jgi:hypothetical protein
MMCLACEQEGMWFAYLQRKGLITPDGFLVEQLPLPFVTDPIEPVKQEIKEEGAHKPADKSAFSCDDPTAG